MVCTACLSPVFAGQAAKYMPLLQESGKLGNRMFHVQLTLSEEPKNAPDLRMYDQYQNVVSGYMVGLWDAFARLRRGAMGIFRSASSAVSALLMGLVYLFVCLKACGGAFGLDAVTQYLGAAANLFQGVVTLVNMLAEMEINGVYTEKHLRLPRPAQQHVSGQPDHRKAERPPVYGGVPGCLLPLPR